MLSENWSGWFSSQQLGCRATSALNSCVFVRHSQHFLLSCSYLCSGVAPGLVSYSLFITPCTAINWLPNTTPAAGGPIQQKMWQQKPGTLPWTLQRPWWVVLYAKPMKVVGFVVFLGLFFGKVGLLLNLVFEIKILEVYSLFVWPASPPTPLTQPPRLSFSLCYSHWETQITCRSCDSLQWGHEMFLCAYEIDFVLTHDCNVKAGFK